MASTFTPNISLEKPARGDDVGTWDTPVNGNMGIADSKLGTIQSISLAGGSITLSTAQAQSAFLNFNGALPSNVTVTIPTLSSAPGTTLSGGFYTIQNQCSVSSAYVVTIATTVSGQQSICCPPFEPFDILVEGTNSSQAGSVKFRNLGRVGTYWDYAGSSVPGWVSACTVPPYLNCDGTTFSSATYPALTVILAGTTLPDSRGRFRAALNQTTARLSTTALNGGVDGNTILAAGGNDQTTLTSSQYFPKLTDSGHTHTVIGSQAVGGVSLPNYILGGNTATSLTEGSCTATTGITYGSSTQLALSMVPPSYIGGLTLIRAA